MELWIRSQNKENIFKANAVFVTKYRPDLVGIRCYITNDISVWLGNYKTRERAIEILDEIENLLKAKIILRKGKITGCVDDNIFREPDGYDIKELSTYVYEMPKE